MSAPIDLGAIERAAEFQAARCTPGIDDMAAYLAGQVADESHREVVGPLLSGGGASGLVLHRGSVVASWGDCERSEMAFSVTKTLLSTVAGVAHDDGLLELSAPVVKSVDHAAFGTPEGRRTTWRHLLQQTSQWRGELWGKPTSADAQSRRPGSATGTEPGSGWAYNDVRVNLLSLALTLLFERSLPDVLARRVLDPLGASSSWSWHGYSSSVIAMGEKQVGVVSGGSHWGGGLWISSKDLALLGQLYLENGLHAGRRLLSAEWLRHSWQPCDVKPEYGLSWWLNDTRAVFPDAPSSGRCARGNGGRHLLWIDPARDLLLVSRWGDGVSQLVAEVSRAIPSR